MKPNWLNLVVAVVFGTSAFFIAYESSIVRDQQNQIEVLQNGFTNNGDILKNAVIDSLTTLLDSCQNGNK